MYHGFLPGSYGVVTTDGICFRRTTLTWLENSELSGAECATRTAEVEGRVLLWVRENRRTNMAFLLVSLQECFLLIFDLKLPKATNPVG